MSRIRVGQVRQTGDGNEAVIMRVEGDAVKVQETTIYEKSDVEGWPVLRKSMVELDEERMKKMYGSQQ